MRVITTPLGHRSLALALGILTGVSCASAPDHQADDQAAEEARKPKPPKPLAPKLDPATIPKFVNQMPRMFTYHPKIVTDAFGSPIRKEFTVDMAKFEDQELPPPFPKTLLFGYGGDVLVDDCQHSDATTPPKMMAAADARCKSKVRFVRTSPGPKFEQTRGIPALIHFRNKLDGAHPLPVDPTLDWANPNNFPKPTPPFLPFPPGYPQAQTPIAHTTHSHGLEVRPEFDGTPDTWFTANGITGPEFVSNDIQQPSTNNASAFWYHDHTFGVTRLDVGMGLNGFTILRDPESPIDFPPPGQPNVLPTGEFEVQMIVGDRSFRTDGSVFYPTAQEQPPGTLGANPDVNPYWMLNIDGDVNIVNGRVWPNFDVKRALYRFRILVASNQRFYDFRFSNGMPLRVIGTDGGFLDHPRTVTSWQQGVTERVDILVDFSNIPVGTKIVLQNTAQRFPPVGPAPDPNTDGTVMQFTVVNSAVVPSPVVPDTLNHIPTLTPDRPTRILIQNVESDDQGRVLQAELDGQLFHSLTTELPTISSTEDWEFVNTTPLTHNKHVHLIEFLLVNRQNIDAPRYLADWIAVNGNPPFTHPTIKLPVEPYLTGAPEGAFPEESGWKDTIRTPAGQVTRIRVRWAPQSLPTGAGPIGQNLFAIDPIYGIGFIWHCHLLEHEDNEMMRPMTVIPIWQMGASYPAGFRGSPGVQRGLVDFMSVDYQARVAIPSSVDPPNTRPDLWERINNQNGDWAVQIIYQVGDRARFMGHIYRALQKHQAAPGTEPNVATNLWELVL
jgi:FtsP/CotA-like multicopper oxidase with cupredoxin domain